MTTEPKEKPRGRKLTGKLPPHTGSEEGLCRCVRCLSDKETTEFGVHSRYKETLYRRKICRACDVIKVREWKRNNPDRDPSAQIAATKAWQARNRVAINTKVRESRRANLGSALAREREKRLKNPGTYKRADERYKAKNPLRVKETARRYRKAHPEVFRIHAKSRRDTIRAGGGGYSKAEWDAIVERFPACPHCLRPWAEGFRPTVDHIIPIARGGVNDASNLQPLCRTCNSKKGKRLENEYAR